MLKVGDKVFIIINNLKISEATIVRETGGGLYMIKIMSGACFQVNRHRLYETYEQAENKLPNQFKKKRLTPYGFL